MVHYVILLTLNLLKKLNLIPKPLVNKVLIKGISGSTTTVDHFIKLKFQLKLKINKNFHFINFIDKFLITDNIPIDILIGNQFMKKYKIHYNYDNNYLYSYLNYSNFINNNHLKLHSESNSVSSDFQKNNFSNEKVKKSFINKNLTKNLTKNSANKIYPNYYKNLSNKNFNILYYNRLYDKFKSNNRKFKNLIYGKNFSKNDEFFINKKFFQKFNNKKYLKNVNKSKNISLPFKNGSKTVKMKNKLFRKKKNNKIKKEEKEKYNYNLLIHSFLSEKVDEDEEEEKEDFDIEKVPIQYRDVATVFSKKEADKLPPHRLTDCKIVLEKDASLHYGPIYPLTEEESEVLKEYLKENLEKGFIRESESPAGYPVLFQKKKDGSLRLCVDYKKLNAVTIRNSYPLPLISDIIEKVKGAKYFTKLDLRSAYNLIRIREGDEYKTAFRTKYGHYEYLVMPFGLKNAPATFQSYINSVLRPFLEKSVILYLDDILVYSKDLEDHQNQVHTILKTLLENNLYAKLEKCEFDKPEVEFLGHILSGEGVATDPKKIKSIEEWPRPENVKDIQKFLGLCNYYRRFVKNFAKIAKPLHNLTRKNTKFNWNNNCEESFQELKKRLTTSPILMHPDTSKPFIVECDASNYAIGAILSQKDDEEKLHPVAYYSRSLHDAELNYTITDKELLAIKDAFATWRHLLLGAKHKVTVYTDHRNLIYTLGGKIGNQRQHRWHLFFQEYNFELIYRQGKLNGKPDSLSRRPDYAKGKNEEEQEYILDSKNIKGIPSFIGVMSDLLDRIKEETKNDATADDIRLYFHPNNANQGYFYKPFRKMNKFKIKDGLILYNNLIYIPEKLRLEILTKYHEKPAAGHLGIKRTLELIIRNFWWPKVKDDVTKYINSCESCARNKVSRHRKYGFLQPLETPERPWKSIEIDFLCGLPPSKGYTVLMVVVDRFSKMIHLIPFKQIPDAKQTAKAFVNNIFKLHGLPNDIYTDRGTQFTSSFWQELMGLLGVVTNIATTDHHETVGQVERSNSFIEQYLRAYSRAYYHDDWVDWIHFAEFAYNNSLNESTNETPFFINYGFHPPMDENYLIPEADSNHKYIKNVSRGFNHIKEVLLRSKELYKRHADKKRMEPPVFKIDDKVWIQSPPSLNIEESSKLAPCKYGPYKVLNVLRNNNYEIDIRKSPFPKHYPIFHVSQLEPYIPTPPEFRKRNVNKESIKDIVEISDFRTNYKKKCYEYRVRYKYRTASNWVPSSEVEDNPRNQMIYLKYLKNGRKFTYI